MIKKFTIPQTSISGAVENYNINLSYDPSFSGISGIVSYNSTNYTMLSSGSNPLLYSKSITTPSVASETNITSYFIIELSNSSDNNYYEIYRTNQTVSSFLIDDCSSYKNTLINMTMLDEDNFNKLNGTINVNVNIFSYATDDRVSFYNASFNHSSAETTSICLANITQNYTMDYSIQYKAVGDYFTRYKNIQNNTINLNNINNSIDLYNLNTDTGNYQFSIIAVGNLISSQGNSGLLVDMQRQYLSRNEFISVESPVTSSEGIGIGALVTNKEIYNFIISLNGEVIGSFNNYKVQCQNPTIPQCSLTLNLAQSTAGQTDYNNYGGISQSFSLDSGTNILYQTYSSSDGESHEVRSIVQRMYGTSNKTICNTTSIGTSGTINCDIPVARRNEIIIINTLVDGNNVGYKIITQGVDQDWFGADILIELLAFSALVFLFIGHPITLVIGGILGLASPVLLLLITGGSFGAIFFSIFYYAIAGGIIIWMMSRKKN